MIERADARRHPADAMIWIDHQQAIIATHHRDGSPLVERLGRGAFEPEAAFAARAVDEVMDSGIVTVAGPAFARTSFERALVAVTHRPDGIIDVEPWMDSPDVADFPARRRDR
jgi:hypothetical protein